MSKSTDLQDRSLIKALIQTKDWDKAAIHEYAEKHPGVRKTAREEGKSVAEVIKADLSYKWRHNKKYSHDDLTRLTILADILKEDKRLELFDPKLIIDFVRSLLGRYTYFHNEAERLKVELAQARLEFSDLSNKFYKTTSDMHRRREHIPVYEKVTTEKIFKPRGREIEDLEKQIRCIEIEAKDWREHILQYQTIAQMAAAIAKECLDFANEYYTAHIDDPGMQKVFATLFTDTKLQLDSILLRVNETKELTRLAEELHRRKAQERKEKTLEESPAAPARVSKTPKSKNLKN